MCCDLISVAMGVRYCRAELDLLKRAIDSILAQSYENIELLICESGSTDEAKACLAKYERRDSRVQLIDGLGAETLAEKLNRCIAAAKGEYIARMDDDDYSLPERMQKQLGYLQENTEISFAGCSVALVREGKPAGYRIFPEYPTVSDFMTVQPFIHPSLIFRRKALESVGGYCEEKWCVGCEDYELLLRLYEHGCIGANMREELLQYTLPPSGVHTRSMGMRFNEARTRFKRYKSLGLLPNKLPNVVKPMAVGLIPPRILESLKKRRWEHAGY